MNSHDDRRSMSSTSSDSVHSLLDGKSCASIALLVNTIIIFLIEGMALSLIGPFFPLEAYNHGIDCIKIGGIAGSFEIASFIMGWFILPQLRGRYLNGLFVIGALINGGCLLGFGLLTIDDTWGYVINAVCLRMASGAGACLVWSNGASVAASVHQNKSTPWAQTPTGNKTMLIMEYALGIGIVLGAPVGGVLYYLGKYSLPFVAIGGVEIFAAIAQCAIMFTASENEKWIIPQAEENPANCCSPRLVISGFLLTGLTAITCAQEGFFTVIAAPQIYKMFGWGTMYMPLIFLTFRVTNTLFTAVFSHYVERDKPDRDTSLILFSITLNVAGTSVLLIPKYISSLNTLPVLLTGICMLFASAPGAFLPMYGVLQRVNSKWLVTQDAKRAATASLNTATCVGNVLGPVLFGGVFFTFYGFTISIAILGVSALIGGAVLIIALGCWVPEKTFTGDESDSADDWK